MEKPFREALSRIYGVPIEGNGLAYRNFISSRMSTAPSDNVDTKPFTATFVNNRGETETLTLSRWDLIYWAALTHIAKGEVDSRAMEILTNENQLSAIRKQIAQKFSNASEEDREKAAQKKAKDEIKGNAIPSNILQRALNQMTQKDWAMAYEARKIFTSFWPLINPVYSRAAGIDMTQIENYMPWIRRPSGQEQVEQMFKWATSLEMLQSPFPRSTHVRLKESSAPFVQIGLPEVFHGFTNEMSQWVATHDVLARLAWMVKDADITSAINEATDGTYDTRSRRWLDGDYMRYIKYHIKGIASQGRLDEAVHAPFWSFLRRMNARAQLAQPSQAPKQMVSALAAIAEIGHPAFVKGLVSFFSNPKGALALMAKAPALNNRYQNILLEMREVQDKLLRQKGRWYDKALPDHYIFFATQLGDRAALMLGGWSVFKDTYDRTKDLGAAYKAFDDFVFTLQQSSEREQLSVLTAGTWRQIFQFLTGPAQLSQYLYKTMGEAIKNPTKENLLKAARVSVVMFVYLPGARFAVSTAMLPPPDDDEEAERWKKRLASEMLQGPFSGLYLLGPVASLLAGAITGEQGYPIEASVLGELDDTKKKVVSAFRKVLEGEDEGFDQQEIFDAIYGATKQTMGLTAGVPPEIMDTMRGLYEYSSGDWLAADIPGLFYGHSLELLKLQRGEE
jgi:hypothetical protein